MLSGFIQHTMRMSHIYQPVMLMELLNRGGSASRREIAAALLHRDESQLEYYEHVTTNMVGRVLTRKRELADPDGALHPYRIVDKDNDIYTLTGFDQLLPEEIEQLKGLCNDQLDAFLTKRSDPWSHRKKSSGYVSGTTRYEVLKRAHFRCELCGISADKKALEVDHVVPRNKGGSDDLSNLQALCYTHNATKRDRDDTDFRGMAESYNHRQEACCFCDIPSGVLVERELAVAIADQYPVTPINTLIIPKRHVSDYFDLHQPERNAVDQLLQVRKQAIEAEDATVTGFNVGMNCGRDAGQTISHAHVHLIPRRKGDVDNPAGGVRGCIPAKQHY